MDLTLFFAGDVMTGRGIDQVLRTPSAPELREAYVRDAREYVRLAEEVSGPIPRAVDGAYVWGDLLGELERRAPEARVINLETSVTTSAEFWPGKGIHYRMHPANLDCLTAARIDVCALANNHTLDFGRGGLRETLAALRARGLRTCGAGATEREATAPAIVPLAHGGRLLVFAAGTDDSGIPPEWAASEREGVARLEALSDRTATHWLARIATERRSGDRVLCSIHWGSNWGHAIAARQTRFAHRLIDGGVDLVFGHSLHHARAIERYRGHLVLYGCGDLIDDYEGISGFEAFRGELRPAYFVRLDRQTGALIELRLALFTSRRFRLAAATTEDRQWLAQDLTRASARFGTRIDAADGELRLR